MVAAMPLQPVFEPGDQRLLVPNVSWKEYVLARELLDRPGVRMTYARGALEIMVTSSKHELLKTNIARFVEFFAHLRGIDLYGYGSTTFKKEVVERGAEPDECYLIGKKLTDYPEIALEVVLTSPLLDKLDVYRAFGVAEVWVFRDGIFTIYCLDASAYAARSSSKLVPGLDFAELARYAVRDDTPAALREFEQKLRG
jgi:Uma2 family endonuclease